MVFYKLKILRCYNTPKTLIVIAHDSQQTVKAAAVNLRAEGVTDARKIEVLGRVKSLKDVIWTWQMPRF